jgi:hypothetical protein
VTLLVTRRKTNPECVSSGMKLRVGYPSLDDHPGAPFHRVGAIGDERWIGKQVPERPRNVEASSPRQPLAVGTT